MKKIILFLSAISFVAITSCSSDDNSDNPDPSSNVLVKRMITIDEDPDGYNVDVTYSYDGNKMVQGVYVDGTIEKWYYTGEKVSKIEYIEDGIIVEKDLFTYNAQGQLVEHSYQWPPDDFEDRNTFVHNNDNTITVTNSNGEIGHVQDNFSSTRVLTITDGEITKTVIDGVVYDITYDDKNSPFKNVTGFADIAYTIAGDHEWEGRAKNISSIFNVTENKDYTVNTFVYNSNGYPTSVTSNANFDDNNPNNMETLTVSYVYE
ncbi:MAG TPA: hypothetical protein VGB44_04405 [Flavobacterium sp.]